jgi:kinesin family protein 2/24
MDKRTARREYRVAFSGAISSYRKKIDANESNKINEEEQLWDENIRVYVRKRPIFKHETDNGEFDVITCCGVKKVVVHDARMHIDMKRQFLNHHEFVFDRVFDEKTNNDKIYSFTASPLVDIAINGGYSTCLVYGQTGSGKTFTMTSIYERAARSIFQKLDESVQRFSSPPSISVSFFEIAGDFCFDLLNAFHPANLLTGSDGSVHPFPLTEPTVTTVEELLSMIQCGVAVRSTAATGVHDASSRSHALLRIYIQRNDDVKNDNNDSSTEGTLTLVDLAGSEHRIDSMFFFFNLKKNKTFYVLFLTQH